MLKNFMLFTDQYQYQPHITNTDLSFW